MPAPTENIFVEYRPSRKAKRISIRIKPDASVKCSYPLWIGRRKAESFVDERFAWIEKHIQHIRSKHKLRILDPKCDLRIGDRNLILFETKGSFKFRKTDSAFEAYYHGIEGYLEEVFQLELKQWLKTELKKSARAYLPGRIEVLASDYDYDFEKLQLRDARTRWGSCSSKNNISLNIHLMRLPKDLADYVILHELVHTKVKNHSSDFWTEMERIYPNAKSASKALKAYDLYLLD